MTTQKIYGLHGKPDRFKVDGVFVTEAEYEAALKPLAEAVAGESSVGHRCRFRPMFSDGLAVDPSQVAEASEAAARAGVPTHFAPDGRPLVTSSRHFRRLAKAAGLVHKGY